ncbi:hypothetical protein J2S03_003145 [Alicyclobacillus cycloheptanicus]|uniref:Uncharacterized protein n=1 Tax=Alicyclobacillus cycloheptanicus TaxID=1457 RepID=A0ABT9XLT7_9BACL|nr:hypothetical protein [Alicyclobacillus cycloheptanicus]
MQPGETFGFRVPTYANRDVLNHFNEYLKRHPRGLGKHLLEVLKKGLEAEGALPPGLPEVSRPRPRRSQTWHARKVRIAPQKNGANLHVPSPQPAAIAVTIRNVNVADDNAGMQSILDLGNFE